MLGGACGGNRTGRCGSRAAAILSRGDPCTRCDYGVLKGHPIPWVRCAGTVGAHRCCGCGVAPPQRPSPLRVCSHLSDNTLNGSVPSSLSALTKLSFLCVAPSCQRGLGVRPRRVGSVGSAPSARHVGGVHVGGIEPGAVAAAGLLRCSQRGPLARHVTTTEYSRGTPPMGTVRGYR
jgi:hypothetical protein